MDRDPDEQAESAPRRVGRYEIVRSLGRGGLSETHLARDGESGTRVALKEVPRPARAPRDFAARLLREMGGVASLSHPGLVSVTDQFEEGGTAYLVTPYYERGSLRRRVGRCSVAQMGGVVETVLAVLELGVERRLTHRDLRPENLLLAKDGAVGVADLGFVRAFMRAAGPEAAGHATLCAPAYAAPELLLERATGPAVDLYATGVVAYELLAGRVPFVEPDDPMLLAQRHAREPPPPLAGLPEVDPPIVRWVERMMVKAPGDRPSGPAEAWAELEPALEYVLGPDWRAEAPILGPPPRRSPAPGPIHRLTLVGAPAHRVPPEEERPVRTGRRRLVVAGVVACLLGGGAAAAAVLLTGGGDGSATSTSSATTAPARTATAAPAALSVAEYRRRANAICARLPSLPALFGAVTRPGQIRSVVLLALQSSLRPAVARLAALEPPESLREAHARALSSSRREVALLQGLADDIGRGADPATATQGALDELDRLERQANTAFADLGLGACTGAPGGPDQPPARIPRA